MPTSHQPSTPIPSDNITAAAFNPGSSNAEIDPSEPLIWTAAPVPTYPTSTITAPIVIPSTVTIPKVSSKDSDNISDPYGTPESLSFTCQSDERHESLLSHTLSSNLLSSSSSSSSSSASNNIGSCRSNSELNEGFLSSNIHDNNQADNDYHNSAMRDHHQITEESESTPSYQDISPLSMRMIHFLPRIPRPAYSSSFLRPGSRFFGTQQSGRTNYEVNVELKTVDLAQSFLSGYFKIEGLTENHPSLTTYFEAEIIGPHYSFFTKHKDWGASERTDLSHWSRFHSFRLIQNKARTKKYTHPIDLHNDTHIFMRWKEKYLVADPTINEIQGASFAGFYYISFDQTLGSITGLYFHSNSEKYQQLDLTHVTDHGNAYSVEFR